MKALIEQINNLSASELVMLNNAYCESINSLDNEIFENDEEFFNLFFDGNPFEVARSTFYGNYNFSHDWVRFDGYGNLETIGQMTPNELADIVENIAQDIIDNPSHYEYFEFSVIEEG